MPRRIHRRQWPAKGTEPPVTLARWLVKADNAARVAVAAKAAVAGGVKAAAGAAKAEAGAAKAVVAGVAAADDVATAAAGDVVTAASVKVAARAILVRATFRWLRAG